jgi:hypothetical protein
VIGQPDHYRTVAGRDVFRDPVTGEWRDVLKVWRAEDIDQFIDARCYRYRFADERSAIHGGRRKGPMLAHY